MVQFLLVLTLISLAYTQVPSTEPCPPNLTVQPNFTAESYLGLFYEYEAYPFVFELTGKCITAEYTSRPDGKIGVFNRMINRFTNTVNSITGYATPDSDEPAKLTVVFPNAPPSSISNYWVLSTDYKCYSVVWSCRNLGKEGSVRMVWILTRNRFPSEETLQVPYEVLDRNGISRKFLRKAIQTGCETVM